MSTIVILLVLIVKFLSYKMDEELKIMAIDSTNTVYVMPRNYLSLFKDSSKVKVYETMEGKTRSPVSMFYYDDKYLGMIYKIPVSKMVSLNPVIIESQHEDKGYSNSWYHGFEKIPNLLIRFKSGKPDTGSAIYLNLHGNATRATVKSRAINSYFSEFDNLSVKYKKEDENDFYVLTKDEKLMPVEVSFIKSDNNFYIFILTVKNYTGLLAPGTTRNILVNRLSQGN
ncbi:hypothetical protein FFF34_000855 [Inquilinus sp. KBS0705]|nr:hypothetical protein FFF34_000855 [Inquilinus sp. KBS0705]